MQELESSLSYSNGILLDPNQFFDLLGIKEFQFHGELKFNTFLKGHQLDPVSHEGCHNTTTVQCLWHPRINLAQSHPSRNCSWPSTLSQEFFMVPPSKSLAMNTISSWELYIPKTSTMHILCETIHMLQLPPKLANENIQHPTHDSTILKLCTAIFNSTLP